MGEGFEHLSQERRNSLADVVRVKRRERDEMRKQAISAESRKLKDLIQNILGKGGGSKNLHKQADRLHLGTKQILESAKEKQPSEIEIIDESDANNLLSDKTKNLDLSSSFGVSPYSAEGFAENPTKQAKLARFFIEKMGLKNRGALLDVGFGANIHIASTFASNKMEAHAIDELQYDRAKGESMWHAPKLVRTNEEGVNIFSGDIADLDGRESGLRDKSFGLILFNGSWTSGGNNWTVAGEVMEAKYHNRPDKTESLVEFMDREKDTILQSCKKHLTNNGLVGVVSSRYAFHGAGYGYDQLPEEKLSFVDVYDRFQRLRAKRIYLLGITQEGFDQILARSIERLPKEHDRFKLQQDEIESVREQLRSVSNLPRDDVYSQHGDNPEYQKSRIRDVIKATKDIPELNKLARIDAVFAEF